MSAEECRPVTAKSNTTAESVQRDRYLRVGAIRPFISLSRWTLNTIYAPPPPPRRHRTDVPLWYVAFVCDEGCSFSAALLSIPALKATVLWRYKADSCAAAGERRFA